MKTEVKTVTPAMAQKFLDQNKGNRRLSQTHINFLALQIKDGKWKQTADPIKFSKEGRLLDGQHRLSAVIKANTPVDFTIASDLDKSIFDVLDTGRGRTAADLVSIKGIGNPSACASTAKVILLFRENRYAVHSAKSRSGITNSDILKFVIKNPQLTEIINYTTSVYKNFRFGLSPSLLAAMYFFMSEKNQTKADSFFDQYSKGLGLTEESPVRVLRDKFIRESNAKRPLSLRSKMACFIICWNNYIKNMPMKQVVFNPDHDFPKIV